MTDPVAARRAAVAAERERLARARERRSKETGGVSGFVQRKWRWLGVSGKDAVETVLTLLKEAVAAPGVSDSDRATLQQALDGAPSREYLLPAVRAGLSALPPASVLRHLRGLWSCGIEWLTEAGLDRCRLLCSTTPGGQFVSKRNLKISGGPAFSLYATAATRGAIPLPNRYLDEVLAWAPLSVLDDLIDHGGLMADDAPWRVRDTGEALYLRARLTPGRVSPEEAERLRWQEYLRRRAFLNGETLLRQDPDDVWDLLYDVVRDGDVEAIPALDAALPRVQQIELRDIRSGALSGQWSLRVTEDQGMWRLLAALWQPTETVDALRSPFYALIALRRAYDLLKVRDLEAASRQARSLIRTHGNTRGIPDGIAQEGYAIAAYTAALESEQSSVSVYARDKLLDTAEEYAESAANMGGEAAARNLRLLRAWRATRRNDRGPFWNPFLDIGLDHGSPGWEERCREIYRECEGDALAQSRLNLAEERIRAALREDTGWEVFYQVPLDSSRYVIPSEVPRNLVPPVRELPRRTSPITGEELEGIRARAAVELLDDFRTTVPRLDRHRSLM